MSAGESHGRSLARGRRMNAAHMLMAALLTGAFGRKAAPGPAEQAPDPEAPPRRRGRSGRFKIQPRSVYRGGTFVSDSGDKLRRMHPHCQMRFERARHEVYDPRTGEVYGRGTRRRSAIRSALRGGR